MNIILNLLVSLNSLIFLNGMRPHPHFMAACSAKYVRFQSPPHVKAMALRRGLQTVADLGAAAVEVLESDSTLALAMLQEKEQDYCV